VHMKSRSGGIAAPMTELCTQQWKSFQANDNRKLITTSYSLGRVGCVRGGARWVGVGFVWMGWGACGARGAGRGKLGWGGCGESGVRGVCGVVQAPQLSWVELRLDR